MYSQLSVMFCSALVGRLRMRWGLLMSASTDGAVARVRAVFDMLDGEWDRLRKDVAGRVGFEIHCRFLDDHLTPGARVLEIGAGPGVFTQHLVRVGARVTVTDLSAVQLAENRRRLAEAGLVDAVAGFLVADVRDLSRWADGSFDLAVAYGGPLSSLSSRRVGDSAPRRVHVHAPLHRAARASGGNSSRREPGRNRRQTAGCGCRCG